jgi:hypothetical protein
MVITLSLPLWYGMSLQICNWMCWQIPARFDITLVRESMTNLRGSARKLLNTEKLMFHVDNTFPKQMRAGTYYARVIVTVHPEGILSKYQLSDQPFIIYNICEWIWHDLQSVDQFFSSNYAICGFFSRTFHASSKVQLWSSALGCLC